MARYQLDADEKVRELLRDITDKRIIILLDNFEDLLNGNRELKDAEIEMFFNVCMRNTNSLKLVITSREPLELLKRREFLKFNYNLLVKDGLPIEDAAEMLRDLDPAGDLGLRDAELESLETIAQLVHGVPRAIEVVASILAHDPFTDLDQLLNQKELYRNETFVNDLVRENYKRLDLESRRVMESLAVFSTPVAPSAVDFMLQPFMPGTEAKEILKQLVNTHTVTYNKTTQRVSLHPIDRDYIYNQLPEQP